MATVRNREAHSGAAPSPTATARQVMPAASPAPAARGAPRQAKAADEDGLGRRYLSAQLTRLDFIHHVLQEVQDPTHPLLQRTWMLGISHMRLDEFFEIDVSGLWELREGVQAGSTGLLPDGRTVTEMLEACYERVRAVVAEQDACWQSLRQELAANGIFLVTMAELDERQRAAARTYYQEMVYPVLTPLAIDPAHKFPHLSHRSLNFLVALDDPDAGRQYARVKVPGNLPRLVSLPPPEAPNEPAGEGAHTPSYFVWLESLIEAHLEQLFPGVPTAAAHLFRVTRDADVEIREREGENLLHSVQQGLRERFFGFVVRLEHHADLPEALRTRLIRELHAEAAHTEVARQPLGLRDLVELISIDRPDLKYPPFVPRVPALAAGDDIFGAIRRRDILLHHPFDSFAPVVQFIEAAAADPDVLAIKQTLYRVGNNSPIVEALKRARENDKQVAVLLELKARGDEENNIEWAQELEEAGVHVVYGIVGLKTHCKAALVVRREGSRIRRYVHLGTGNYNPATARGYTDLGLLTCRPELGADVTDLFNRLTGYSRQTQYRCLLVSPRGWRQRLVELIEREMAWAARGERAHVICKVNGLTDPEITDLFYRASGAGVQLDLLVREMCILRPRVPGLSDDIRVISIVGRFLEHHRIFYFRNGGNEEVYLGSADLMPRNLDRRVETVFPVEDEGWRAYLRDEVLRLYLSDTARARELQPDGSYVRARPAPGVPPLDAQATLLAGTRLAAGAAVG
ncbi:MAG TPA: polyphosphate kinase 1 [Chloroflexota bacterium]|nr:polyphosphate kinase 1 [Chloroflexota bacterium]